MKKKTMRKNKYNKKRNLILLCTIVLLSIVILLITLTIKKRLDPLEKIKITQYENSSMAQMYDTEEVLINPGKGFVLRDYFNETHDDIIAVNYCRIEWSTIEPEKGKYNWSVIDEKIASCEKREKKFAFGIMNANSSSSKVYVTPKWVFDEGAKNYTCVNEQGVTQVIPIWTDDIFLNEVNNFVKVLGERYDGNPNIAYIDIRSYGNWGEQHLISMGGEELTAEQLQELYIKPYQEAFQKTLLVNVWGKTEYNEVYNQSIDNGITIRRDGIMKLYNGKHCFDYAYGKLPTIFEYYSSYENLKKEGLWSEGKLLDYIEQWKPSYIEFYPEMYKDNPKFCKMIANKIGYYFKLKKASYTNSIFIGNEENIQLTFANEGVAPLYEDCTVYIGLLDEDYNLVKKYKTNVDPHTWTPGEEKNEDINITFDDIQPGKYIMSVGLFLNENNKEPTYLLGNTGKTKNKWYVMGEVTINEKQENYNILLNNQDYYINGNEEYTIDVAIQNIKQNNEYIIEKYLNNVLTESIKIESNQVNYYNSFDFNLLEGDNILKIIIRKNGQEVSKLEKAIYVYFVQEDMKVISNTVLNKYAEFEKKFDTELANIDEIQEQISKLKVYISYISDNESETQENAIKLLHEHFYLGKMILDAFNNDKLDVEYVRVSSMLDMLNDIGNWYEDLITLSATSRKAYYTATEKLINKAEATINSNSDLDIIYPTKILDFAKELHEKSEYINSLEEENDIKTGLIVSNSLHAYYLADWANDFANIYVNKYIKANPVTVSYSNTDEFTNQDITVTLNVGTDSKVTNNNGQNTYIFTKNGTFIFEYERRGQVFKEKVKVTSIDKDTPVISGVVNGKIYTESVTPAIKDENLKSIEVLFNGESIQYNNGTKLTQEGIYNIVAIDKAGNKTEIEIYIIEKGTDGYIVDNGYILNVRQETKVEQFAKKFNLSTEYSIKRSDNNLSNNDIIATGDILQLKNGSEYTIVVAGDINKDGKVTTYDLSTFRRYILNLRKFDEIESLAADINIDKQELGVKDYTRMRIEILGKY